MNDPPIQVLLIEDNPGDIRLLQELLKDVVNVQFAMDSAISLQAGIQKLGDRLFDVILLDLTLPDSQHLDTFTQLQHHAPNTAIVVITGLDDQTLALKAMQQGAQDYLVKSNVTSDLLERSIRYAIERKRAEQKIREQAALLDIATDAILVRDMEGTILFWNKGAERLYGWPSAEAKQQKVQQLLYPPDSQEYADAQAQLLATGQWYGELTHLTRDQRTITVASHWTLMRNEHQQPKSILVVSTDITEKKQLEAQFLRTQRMESIGTLASGIAHDLNNILTPILASAQLLQIKRSDLDERSLQMLKSMEINAKRGAALVRQVLSFARGVEGKHMILHLEHLVLELKHIIEQTFPPNISLSLQIPADLWVIVGNATQLHQVFMNLCVNARDAMPQGGTLTISAQNLFIDETNARKYLDAENDCYIVITVADTGVGISPSQIDRIFEPFFTTKAIGKGTGLGLSTALGIIRSHGGFIHVDSELNQGTQFQVFLPAINILEQIEYPHHGREGEQRELILLIDDEDSIRGVSQFSLEAQHYRVLSAEDGYQALHLVSEHQEDIALVIVDVVMPTMDGVLMLQEIQQRYPQIKVIVTSGLAIRHELARANLKIDEFLPKPYTVKELINTVQAVLDVRVTSPQT
jgi:two-component system cell cycle sensor histidine kinase/response regulator CckA